MEKANGKSDGDEYAELVNGDHDAGGTVLQRVIIAEPRQSGGETGEDQKTPDVRSGGGQPLLFSGEKHDAPGEQQYHRSPDCRRQIGVDAPQACMAQKGTGPGRCGKMKRLVLFFEERSDIIMELQPVRDMQNNEKARQKIRATGYAGGRALDDGAP